MLGVALFGWCWDVGWMGWGCLMSALPAVPRTAVGVDAPVVPEETAWPCSPLLDLVNH